MDTSHLDTLYGKTAILFSRADYMLDGKENEFHFGPLQIQFQDNSFLTLSDNGDAESISISTQPLVFEPETEGTISWRQIILNDRLNWNSIVNKKVAGIYMLLSIKDADLRLFGLMLLFENDITLTYYNCYDDSTVIFGNDNTLTLFIADLKLQWTKVNGQ